MTKPDLTHKQLSLSGFPFQLRVEREVVLTEEQHGWNVVAREQAWTNTVSNISGFIDLVLQHKQLSTLRLVIECKRQRGNDALSAQWLFLIPEEEDVETDIVRCLSLGAWKRKRDKQWEILRVWDDVRITPHSKESQFCVMQSDESRRQSILESLCRELLDSIDGLVEEEINISNSSKSSHLPAFYIPVIVTNAQIKLCTFNVESIPLMDGIIPQDRCKTEIVPFVRFRKSLANDFPFDNLVTNLKQANQARERTVFVVNSESLKDFLIGWSIKPMDSFDGYALQRRIQKVQSEE